MYEVWVYDEEKEDYTLWHSFEDLEEAKLYVIKLFCEGVIKSEDDVEILERELDVIEDLKLIGVMDRQGNFILDEILKGREEELDETEKETIELLEKLMKKIGFENKTLETQIKNKKIILNL